MRQSFQTGTMYSRFICVLHWFQNCINTFECNFWSCVHKELEKTKLDLAALKEQASGLTREYDRLLEEHSKAQVRLVRCLWSKDTTLQQEMVVTKVKLASVSSISHLS